MEPEAIVRAELDAWSRLEVDEIMRYLAPDAVWEDIPLEPISGYDAIRKRVEFVQHTTSAEIEILNLASVENIVLTERNDRFLYDGVMVVARVMGAFETRDDTIVVWRDYYDLGQTRRSAASTSD